MNTEDDDTSIHMHTIDDSSRTSGHMVRLHPDMYHFQ